MKQVADELEREGHAVSRAVLDRRGVSRLHYARLAGRAVGEARRSRPDVVYAHFLVPAGLAGALAARAARRPLVVTAHGQDVANVGMIPGIAAATRFTVRHCRAVVAVSDYLRRELLRKLPEAAGRIHVVDCGVDLERFRGRDADEARRKLGWAGEGPFYLCVGSLIERKNVIRLAEAFARLGRGTLAFVGDGPLRARLEGRERVKLAGRVPHEAVADWIAACDVLVQPSLIEPFGQALLEAMASERSVVATRVGGPPEFVVLGAGVLVDPTSVDSIEEGLRVAERLPRPNPVARAEAAKHDVTLQARRIAEILEGAPAQ